ncbi:hypothetical protein RDI58_006699 [Solanum bulbocastanum]|uniref:Zinc finger protein n=1 Tax=Solanum bulbocastanum TaxID=147425 RepID=A0AAN8TXB8_SOLBU
MCGYLKIICVFLLMLSLLGDNYGTKGEPQVPCYFIFGDSLVDNGNNNVIRSLARADYLPYGIDFPDGPTGRFSNGKTTVDVIAELLGFDDYIPPYATARGREILRGVNFASAAAGIREETGQQLTLYNYGARKFVLIGVGQIGCSPNALAQNSPDGRTCAQNINVANQLFNNKLRELVDNLNRNTPNAKLIYINAYGIFQDLIDNPFAFAELIGFNSSIPPHATASGSEILRGVNYGSGVAGIRDETGYRWGDRISMDMQLLNHQVTILRINSILSNFTATTSLLNKCLYTVDMGNNDYLNNYLDSKFYPSSRTFTPDMFATILVQQFEGQLRRLHSYGARKVAVSNIGLLGCLPEETRTYGRNASGCVDFINNYVQLFNQKLKVSIDNLNTNLPNARFIISNQTSISTGGPPIVFDSPCCIISNTTAKGQCSNNGQTPCSNRNQYVFFDNFHPTEAANRATATRSYTALLPTDSYPTDIRGLVQT